MRGTEERQEGAWWIAGHRAFLPSMCKGLEAGCAAACEGP